MEDHFTIAGCEVKPLENTIYKGDKKQIIQPKYMELLVYLVNQYPSPVTREQIIQEVWDGNNYVGENALNNAVWNLRKAFATLLPNVVIIETIRKTGYRLLEEPKPFDDNAQANYTIRRFIEPKTLILISSILVALFVMLMSVKSPSNKNTNIAVSNESITQFPGRELFPSLSPDGRYLTFSWRKMEEKPELLVELNEKPTCLPPKRKSDVVARKQRQRQHLHQP